MNIYTGETDKGQDRRYFTVKTDDGLSELIALAQLAGPGTPIVHRDGWSWNGSTRARCYTYRLKVSNVSIHSWDSIAQEARGLQSSGKRVVFTNGCFDVIHPGHLDLLRRARALGDVLVVAINSDGSVRRLKGPRRPVFPENERGEILSALNMVDFVCAFDEDTPLEAILAIRPDILVKGADWADNIVGSKEVEGWGGKVVALPLVEGQSTTGIIERVLDRGSSI